MNPSILHTLALAGGFLGLFGSAVLIYNYGKVKAEITRKYVHIATGLITLLFPVLLDNQWLILLLCSSFAVILLLSLRFKKLQSINGIERESRGSLLYPIVVYGAFLVYDYYDSFLFFYIPILILAISDALAGLCGKIWPMLPFKIGNHSKTGMGTIVFFVSAFVISFTLLLRLSEMSLGTTFLLSILISITTAFAEAVSQKGYDNLMIPVTAMIILVLAEQFSVLVY